MSDAPDPNAPQIVDVDVRTWVEAARANPLLYADRQIAEIVLASIGLSPSLRTTLVLKGGALMALAFNSLRLTGDVDFTAEADPEGFAEKLAEELNALLPRTALRLGYVDLHCRVQKVEKKPRPANFADHRFPALLVRVGSAIRGRDDKRWAQGHATSVVDVEISFRDQVYATQELRLTEAGVAVRAFTLEEVIAEKYRALLQQPGRDRYRRQDVYDIAFLLEANVLDAAARALVLDTLIKKCANRDLAPSVHSIRDPEVMRRAKADWGTLKLELAHLPLFDERFSLVADFYESLPWGKVDDVSKLADPA